MPRRVAAWVTRLSRLAASSGRPASEGAFGIPGLHRPQDFGRLAAAAIEKCEQIRRKHLRDARSRSAHDVLKMLDAISNELCIVIDTAELCRNIHADRGFQDASNEAFAAISAYIQDLNTDKQLYQLLCAITDNPVVWASLSEEEQRFASDMKADFEKDGIHLPDTEKAKSAELRARLDQLEALFWRHVIENNQLYKLGPVNNAIALRTALKDYIPQTLTTFSSDSITASTNKQSTQLLLQWVDDERARHTVFTRSFAEPASNAAVLEELVEKRALYARRAGFPSYAHQTLRNHVVHSPEDVMSFLEKVAAAVRPKAEQELEVLKELKRRDSSEPLRASDMLFYMNVARQRSISQHAVNTQFGLGACLDGLKMICRELFDISMQQEEIGAGERWVPPGTKGVYKFSFAHPQEGNLGTVLFDTMPREGKFNHAAHFTLRCGSMYHTVTENGEVVSPYYQRPIVALVTNFAGLPVRGDHSISFNQLQTLFHEFGHALHSILSRTTFQHLSGTRGSADFVEIPSHLMEYFARDRRVLKRFAKDLSTGSAVSDDVIDGLLRGNAEFSALDMQYQILHAMMDQFFFNGEIDKFPSFEDAVLYLQAKYTCLPAEDTEAGPLPVTSPRSFTHFAGYGGSYYAYILAQAYAAHLWHQEFARDPLSRHAGDKLWHEFLAFGGSREPRALLRSLLGGEVDASYLLSEMQHGVPQ